MPTRGIHLIWTTYGSWLPGDARGHWSPLFDLYGRLRRAGHQLNLPDTVTRRRARARMREPLKTLADQERGVVAETLADHLVRPASSPDADGVPCHAAAIERAHVHLLVAPMREDLGRFVGRLKGVTSSAVGALAGNEARRRTWAAGYWHVFLFADEALRPVRDYIVRHNVARSLPADPFPWAGVD